MPGRRGRPPLAIGESGEPWFKTISPNKVRAYCWHRDPDGQSYQVEGTGPTRGAALRRLKANCAARNGPDTDDITGDTKLKDVAPKWLATIDAAVEAGERSPATAAAYRGILKRHIIPATGEWRLREATTGKIDRVLITIREKSGASIAKSARTVLSGILGYAARQDAITSNPTRNTSAISTKPKRQPRALTVEEVGRWLERLANDPRAVRHDLVDLTGFMLATGVRIGEALAVEWDDVDLIGDALRGTCIVRVDWTIVRVPGRPLFRKPTKTAAGLRTLRLPEFAVTMLRRRAVEMYVLATGILPPGGFRGFQDASPSEGFRGFEDASAMFELNSVDFAPVKAQLSGTPVFPDSRGGWRDPSNTRREIRSARGEEFKWVTSHSYRKTAATMLDAAGLTARQIANQLGHSRISLTQDVYMSRTAVDPHAAMALDEGLRGLFSLDKPWAPDSNPDEHLA